MWPIKCNYKPDHNDAVHSIFKISSKYQLSECSNLEAQHLRYNPQQVSVFFSSLIHIPENSVIAVPTSDALWCCFGIVPVYKETILAHKLYKILLHYRCNKRSTLKLGGAECSIFTCLQYIGRRNGAKATLFQEIHIVQGLTNLQSTEEFRCEW